jgi:uncharacterized protein (DUF952 family)
MSTGRIVHICSEKDWQAALAEGVYKAPSLEMEGFIHCSRKEQVLQVANRFYPNQRDLVILCIESELLEVEIRWETVDEGVFPHVYGPLNLNAIIAVEKFSPDIEGFFRDPPHC